jgi:hypothetical protein
VIEREPDTLKAAAAHLVRHRAALVDQLSRRGAVLQAQFDAIDALAYRPTFDEASRRAADFLAALPS